MKKIDNSTTILILWKLWTIILIVGAILNTGCITIEENDHDCDDAVVIEPPTFPQPQPGPAHLGLLFGGPPGGTEIRVAGNDEEVLCFNAQADQDIEIRNLRLEITSPDGLVYGGTAQYRDVKFTSGATVVAGPIDLSNASLDTTQNLVFHDVFRMAADQRVGFCVKLDVNNDDLLDGNTLYVKLMPFQNGDVVRVSDGAALALENIEPNTGLWTVLTVRGIQGPSVQRNAPYVTAVPLPTTVLVNSGTIIAHRMTITAPSTSDVLVMKLSYASNVSSANPNATSLYNARVRVVGDAIGLGGWSDVLWYGGDCAFAATWSNRCVRVFLEQPLRIAAGTSVTIELEMDISGALVSGDSLTTGASMDTYGNDEGPLVGQYYISGAPETSMLWSNDGLWWYNGHSVNWGTPFAQTLVRY